MQTYRELWEKKYGEIKVGRNKKSKVQVAPLIGGETDFEKLVQLAPISQREGEDGKRRTLSFAKHVADRIGFSQDV
ncbi:MAG: chromosome partitioning protein, partial [Bartonella sp.]|nr:chromosome partitioning protein [Bartonella sp.]